MRLDCPLNTLLLAEVCALAGTRFNYFSVFKLVASRSVKHKLGFFIARVFFCVPIYGLLYQFLEFQDSNSVCYVFSH